MPIFLRQFLLNRSLSQHFFLACIIGLIFRWVSAFYAYGPLAIDDFNHVVIPAGEWFQGHTPSVPAYRSHLPVWLMQMMYYFSGLFLPKGLELVDYVRFALAGLGTLSLTTIVGGYFYGKSLLDKSALYYPLAQKKQLIASLSLYLLSIHCLMPFVSTRAFGESISMGFVMLGIGLAENGRVRHKVRQLFLGILLLGFSVLLRYQNGLLYVTYSLYILFISVPKSKKSVFGVLAIASLLLLGGEIAIDYLSGRSAFSTLQAYFEVNEGGAARFGVSPWYNHFLTAIAITLPPFSFFLFRNFPKFVRSHTPIALCLGVFLVAHSFIPHKEERFLIPVLPLILIMLSAIWVESGDLRNTKRYFLPWFGLVNTLLLFGLVSNNSQAPQIEPFVNAVKGGESGLFFEFIPKDEKTRLSEATKFFIKPGFELVTLPTTIQTQETLSKIEAHKKTHDRITFLIWEKNIAKENSEEKDPTEFLTSLQSQMASKYTCSEIQSSGSFFDRLLFKMNPKFNGRRRPIFYTTCSLHRVDA